MKEAFQAVPAQMDIFMSVFVFLNIDNVKLANFAEVKLYFRSEPVPPLCWPLDIYIIPDQPRVGKGLAFGSFDSQVLAIALVSHSVLYRLVKLFIEMLLEFI